VYFSTEKEVEVFGTEDIENAPRSEKFWLFLHISFNPS
jgi:hypothetical protein